MHCLWPDIKKPRPLRLELCEGYFYDPFWEDYEKSQLSETSSPDWRDSFSKAREKLSTIVKLTRLYAPEIKTRLKTQLRSPEFWLGVFFGVITRITTKIFITAAFPSRPELAALASFVACAGAGLAAGVVTHFVRTFYRNSKATTTGDKSRYGGMTLFESALIGLFGGLLGGYATNVGTVVARGGSFALGASVGVAAGVVHASLARMKSAQNKPHWTRLTLQGTLLGALGGVLGIVLEDLFAIQESVAAPIPIGEAGSVIYTAPTPPRTPVYMPENCADDRCMATPKPAPPPQVVVAPVEQPPAPPQEAPPPAKAPAHHPARPRHVRHHSARAPVQRAGAKHVSCPKHAPAPKHQIVPKRPRLVRPVKPVLTPVEKNVVLDRPKFLVAPPQALPPPPQNVVAPQAPPVDPCDSPACASSGCSPHAQLMIKGPCADPNTPCVEKVSFNQKGDVTKVVLQPHPIRATKPYFEIQPERAAKAASWRRASYAAARAARAAPDASRVALIIPFVNPSAQHLAEISPQPA